jgi:hypothetical protein
MPASEPFDAVQKCIFELLSLIITCSQHITGWVAWCHAAIWCCGVMPSLDAVVMLTVTVCHFMSVDSLQEFGPTGKEGKLMLPHPSSNDKGRNILQVRCMYDFMKYTTAWLCQQWHWHWQQYVSGQMSTLPVGASQDTIMPAFPATFSNLF